MKFSIALLALALAGCGTIGKQPEEAPPAPPVAAPQPPKPAAEAPRRPGAYYKDDGPHEKVPVDLATVADAVPRAEAPHRYANRPYQVFGVSYAPIPSIAGFRQKGIASWYGRRFHGQATSSGEPYDMYAMTAAHPLLPIPSYVRVTNTSNRKSVVVRINDRGPFHAGRVIDLSYAAAWKLGYIEAGSAEVEIEGIVPGQAVAATVASAADAAAESAMNARGVFIQLGAFSARESADSFRARVTRELAWLSDTVHVLSAGGLFRLQVGPYRSQDQARPIAERIESELAVKPLFVFR